MLCVSASDVERARVFARETKSLANNHRRIIWEFWEDSTAARGRIRSERARSRLSRREDQSFAPERVLGRDDEKPRAGDDGFSECSGARKETRERDGG